MLKIKLTVLLATAFFTANSFAQDLQLDEGAVGSYLRLKELQTTGSVLHVVAHPDDEDGAMLAYCARGLGVRTMLFAITRGEGGANLISSHFFDELGALRTLEHLKAASYYGNELFYSRAADYGYSKTLEEAMKQWQNGLPVLRDLVEVIRREKPTIILSRFAGDPRDGHGHHQMAGVVSRLAFDAAADPNQFPEQIHRGLSAWQVEKLYVRAGSRWRKPDEKEWTIALPTGTFDPVIGKSYAQVARFGLGFQRSQGISGHAGDPGPQFSYYRLAKQAHGAKPAEREHSLFDGLDLSLAGLVDDTGTAVLQQTQSELASFDASLRAALREWHPAQHESAIRILANVLGRLRSLAILKSENESQCSAKLRHALTLLDRELQDAIISLVGLRLEAWATDLDDSQLNHVTSDEPLRVHVRLANQGTNFSAEGLATTVSSSTGETTDVPWEERTALPGTIIQDSVDLDPKCLVPNRPHWRRSSVARSMYEVAPDGDQRPTPAAAFIATSKAIVNGVEVALQVPVETRVRHPEYGRVSYPLTCAPALSVSFDASRGIIASNDAAYSVPITVRTCKNQAVNGTVKLHLPAGWKSNPPVHEFSFAREDEAANVRFDVVIPRDAKRTLHQLTAVAEANGTEYREGFETVSARDVGRLNIYRQAVHQVQVVDVQIAGDPAVGYIPGSGDKVAESLVALGVTPTILSESDIANGDLSQFHVILVGVRAYAVREDIRTHNSRLLNFVRRGGTLIVQYQTPEFDQNFGPYPYEMGRGPEEVSEEDASVTVLEPAHPLFITPNRIVQADFDGWFEQRGSKFWKTWDERYTPLLECHDAGQAPQKGGMLIAKFGKGVYVYSAYAWYRQLPHGVPGAYRLFANLLSLPRSGLVE